MYRRLQAKELFNKIMKQKKIRLQIVQPKPFLESTFHQFCILKVSPVTFLHSEGAERGPRLGAPGRRGVRGVWPLGDERSKSGLAPLGLRHPRHVRISARSIL